MPSNRQSRWVIFAGPQQLNRPGTRYIAKDGSVTSGRSEAAKFLTYWEAEEFAKKKSIELTTITYIGQDDFTDSELYPRQP